MNKRLKNSQPITATAGANPTPIVIDCSQSNVFVLGTLLGATDFAIKDLADGEECTIIVNPGLITPTFAGTGGAIVSGTPTLTASKQVGLTLKGTSGINATAAFSGQCTAA